MTKLLQKPEEIVVKTNASGAPLSLSRKGRHEKVTAIYDNWKIVDQWWGKEIERHYFRIKMRKGLVLDIYHEINTRKWYLSKIYD